MKKTTFYLSILALLLFSWNGIAQTLNQNASWPNGAWTLTGTYTPAGLLSDPTGAATTFSFDDDAAGNGSADDLQLTSPVIDLTAANGAGETWITVSGDYVYRPLGGDVLAIEVYDADAATWSALETFVGNSTNTDYQTCAGIVVYTTAVLDISGYTPSQLSGFQYRIIYDDQGGWQWGFCLTSPTITSAAPPACIPATFTLSQGTNNCPVDEFFIDVDITALGSATTVNILNDGGAAAVSGVDGSASPYSVGPFPAGTDVMITVEDASVACEGTDSLTTLASCPPDCATAPITPLDGATGLSAIADINFSWTAPASGPTPDSYDFYIGFMSDGSDQAFFANTPDTFFDVAFGQYGLTVYWSVVPKVGAVDAVGPCSLWSVTSENAPGDECLTAPFGQWPGAVYDVAASATCDGSTVNDITTCGYNGEYSMVAVVAGENYRFESSVATDFVTISSEDGTSSYIGSYGYVIWTSTITGNVRFYTHVDNSCGDLDECRTRSVTCGATLSTEDFDTNGDLFSYYPNPVTNNLTINAQKDIQNVVVYNMLGQQVMRTAPNAVNSEVDMTTLNPGSYFVQVTINNTTETIRIIKN